LTTANAQNQQGLDELRDRAEEAYEAGRLLDALADYERLVSLFPEEGCLHGRLAGCALREPGRLTLARRHLRIAIKFGCSEVDVEFHRARLAQLEYDFERARDLYAAYLAAAGKKARFKEEARVGSSMCSAVIWDPTEAIGLDVLDRFPADPDGAFRFYRPQTPGIRLVNTPKALRSKADNKTEPGRIAFHNGDTVLVYASLGKSGKTGWDLYQISLSGGEYGDARRLSDSVNSVYDERGAYLSRDGVLYFSSNRPGGLGGQDIYAVKWGTEGPVGIPERLPFPVNSVNDDEFFIPEPDGGAWMSSNRAAREGRIHAYRVALSEAPFDAGSVSWLADEVASDGMTLRVYSNGEEVSVRKLDGEGAEFQSLIAEESAVGVRIVLEDRDGQIVSESFGAADSSWELRKQGRGWTMVERNDVDWAMLADLRSQDGLRTPQDEGATGEVESVATATGVQGWGDWVSDRIDSSALDGGISSGESVAWVADVNGVANEIVEMPDPEGGALEGGSLDGEDGPTQDALSIQGGLEEEGATAVEITGPRTVSTLLLEGDAPTTEELLVIEEEEPEALAAVWNDKAEKLLVQESNFLDAPSMARAGVLSDLVEGLSEWSPNPDLMARGVRDGAAVGEVEGMIEAWTYAVQSATKASLVNVAGDAALAYRRERLALREIEALGSGNLSEVIGALSDWQAKQGDEVAVTGVDNEVSKAEIGAWLEEWEAGLDGAEVGWSRKQRAGWRGDWLKRQRRHMEVVREQWELQLKEIEDGALAVEFEGPDGMEEGLFSSEQGEVTSDEEAPVGSSSGENSDPTEGEADSISEDMEFLEVPFGRNSSETLVRFVLGRPMTETGEGAVDLSAAGVQDLDALMQAWEASILNSRKVEKAWDRMIDRNGGRGIPLVMGTADFEILDAEVAQELLDLKQAMLELLSESVVALRAFEPVSIEPRGEELLLEGESESFVRAQMAMRREEWERAQSNTDERGTSASKLRGVERFQAQVQWHEALVRESGVRSAYQESLLAVQDELTRLEEERLQAERIEAEQVAMAEQEEERIEAERIEAERVAMAEQEAERIEAERVAMAEQEEERIESERVEAERVAMTEQEAERIEAERIEAERIEAERVAMADQRAGRFDVQAAEDEGFTVELIEGDVNGEEAVFPGRSSGSELALGLSEEAVSDAIRAGLPADWTLEMGSDILDASLVYAPNASGNAGGSGWSDEDWRLIQSWAAFRELLSPSELLGEEIKLGSDKDKDRFFATRDVQRALAEVDLALFESRLQARRQEAVAMEANLQESAVDNLVDENGNEVGRSQPASMDTAGDLGDGNARGEVASVDPIGDAVFLQYGVTLPEAEVVGEGGARNSGIRLRPIQREVLEKAILGSMGAAESMSSGSAEETFARPDGRPKADGVEYKIQVGAFRKALPAALFSAFDPMWAQRLANGITRYLAGSFDAYDSAVEARDAIRALGYSDAFVVRFVSGERVRAARPDAEELALERDQVASEDLAQITPSDQASAVAVEERPVLTASEGSPRNDPSPEVPEDIPTWSDVQGRVYSVQVGAFRGVPDAQSLEALGTLTREDSGSDGWLRLFSGRFDREQEAIDHRNELRSAGRGDAFVVVYINGRRIPLAQASTTAIAGIANMSPEAEAQEEPEAKVTVPAPSRGWWVELGRFDSTIPVRLANAILDAPLNWDIKSDRQGVQTVYLTRSVDSESEALGWMEEAKRRGFAGARVLNQDD